MQKKFYSLLALVFFFGMAAIAQTNSGTLMGKVHDKDTGEPLSFATVIVFLNGNTVNGGSADIDGKYSIKPLEPGTYDVTFQSVGYKTQTVKGVVINASKISFQGANLVSSTELGEVEVFDYKVPFSIIKSR